MHQSSPWLVHAIRIFEPSRRAKVERRGVTSSGIKPVDSVSLVRKHVRAHSDSNRLCSKARGEIWTVEPVIFRVARIIERLSELGLGLSVEQSLRDDVNGRRQGR